MITQYVMTMKLLPEHPIYVNVAYRLYAFLLEQLPEEKARQLHEAGNRGLSQYVQIQKEQGTWQWIVSLLTEEISDLAAEALNNLTRVEIEQQTFAIAKKEIRQLERREFLTENVPATYATIRFCTPTAFKQNGRYAIFPQERLLLQSMISRWNEAFPECSLGDQDAFEALLAGLHIVDYRLSTGRFLLKGVRIPGFMGTCVIEAKLAPPLLELWSTLLSFANYSGIGIKTGIGMGGVQTCVQEQA